MRVVFALKCVFLFLVLTRSLQAEDQTLARAAQLDQEHKCGEADQVYRSAILKGPPSIALLNNLGNHHLACGSPEKARSDFERVLKLNPTHPNANQQLARLALIRKDGTGALTYLSRIKDPDLLTSLVRVEALEQIGDRKSAAALAGDLSKSANGNPQLLFALGMTCGRAKLYELAEASFNSVLAQVPDDYDVLYNLGLAAARAEHYERGKQVFEAALKVKPNDIDALIELGRVESNLGNYIHAIYLLAQARSLAPRRPDALLGLARATQSAGFYGDSDAIYSEYLLLRPHDEMVRRDRATVHGFSEAGRADALKELTGYVQQHPKDAIGYFDLAQLTYHVSRVQALAQVTTAVRLDPSFEPAHYIRAWLLHRVGRNAESLADLLIAVHLNPRDALAFDQLGLTYMELDKPVEAEQALRQAVILSPNEPKLLLHLARVLTDAGRQDEAQPYLDRFHQVQPNKPERPREEQLIMPTFGIPQAERTQKMLEQLRLRVAANPTNSALKLTLGSLLLLEGNLDEAYSVFHELLGTKPPSSLAYTAGTRLLAREQYGLALEFLEFASPEVSAARVDSAIALFFVKGPDAALRALQQASTGVESGDSLLLKARIFYATGRIRDADKALDEAAHWVLSRPKLAEDMALLALDHQHNSQALKILDQALRTSPEDPGLALARVLALSALNRTGEAKKAIGEIEGRWPEWDQPYILEGLLLEKDKKPNDALGRIRIAIALGSLEPAAKCANERIARSGSPNRECSCQHGIYRSFFSDCEAYQ